MKAATALRTFFNEGPKCDPYGNYRPVTVTEIRVFKEACTPEEYVELAKQACNIMGTEFTPSE